MHVLSVDIGICTGIGVGVYTGQGLIFRKKLLM